MESTGGYLNFSLVLSSCYIKSICSHLNLTHRPYTIKAVFVLLLFKIAISASCLLRRLYKIYMVWPSLLFKIYVPRDPQWYKFYQWLYTFYSIFLLQPFNLCHQSYTFYAAYWNDWAEEGNSSVTGNGYST